ncbi:MAG TPA: hypothetical protein VJX16_26060, partial [Terriglobales bacterium]|nr:hypothetical protein [Terriglobales bacterium]
MKRFLLFAILPALLAIMIGCGGTGSSQPSTNASPAAAIFITGEDAPLPSVLAFNVTLNSITLNNGSTAVSVLSMPTTVDFARLMG